MDGRAGLVPSAASTSDLARGVPDAGGVFLVPSFTGLAAPYWATNARAAMLGMGLVLNVWMRRLVN